MNHKYMSTIGIKLKLYMDANGDAFQKLFSDIMIKLTPSFKRFRPYGNSGDGGNDGYMHNENHYYQCYGPKIHSQTVAPHYKAKEDFDLLLSTGVVIEHWSFVFNDYYSGEYALLKECLENVKNEHKLKSANLINCDEIERLFLELPETDQMVIAPFEFGMPQELDPLFQSDIMKSIISYLFSKFDLQLSMPYIDTNEELETKIKINGLSHDVASRLNMYGKYINIVDDFLVQTPSDFDNLSRHVKQLYTDACTSIPREAKYTPDLRYYVMLNKIVPQNIANMSLVSRNQHVACADIILAKYFEACDIYEH